MSYLDDLQAARASGDKAGHTYRPREPISWTDEWDEDEREEYPELTDEEADRARANSLWDCARRLEEVQREIHEQNLWSAQLYSNRELAAFDWGTGQLHTASLAPVSRTGENIVVRVVDTMVSQVGKNRPKPKPVARGASFYTRRQIKLLDKFLFGEFQRNAVWALGKLAYRDACVFQFGCIRPYVEKDPDVGDRVCYERVFPDEMMVDQLEMVACGKVRHVYRRRVLPVEVVAATYGLDEDEACELADSGAQVSYVDYRPVGKGWVVVIEGIQLGSKRRPGRRVVATRDRILDEEEWPHDWSPYVFFHSQSPISGFYSSSLVEQALPYQIRLNEINEVIRDAQDLMGRPRVLIAEGSRVNPLEIDNVIGRFIKYTGIKPEAITWPAINAELYNERDRQVRVCLEHFGLSNLASTVTPPPGARFDSSAAFREFNAIQDDRLSDQAQRYEEFYLELAKRTIQVIDASGANPKTTWYSGYKKARAEEIEWKEIGYAADMFIMTMEATSLYSMSPAAARDELEKQLAMGLLTPEQYRAELANPDEESALSLQAAAAEDIQCTIEDLENGEAPIPTPEQDLVNGVVQVNLALLSLSKYKDFPEERKLNFVNWLTLARAILNRGTEPSPQTAAPPAEAGMMDPMAGPLGGGPVPVPEAYGLAAAGPGAMPNI